MISWWIKEWRFAGKLKWSQTDCLPQKIMVASKSVRGSESVIRCEIEETMAYKFDTMDKSMYKSSDDEQPVEADCSFFHAVVNMCGMLMGLGQLSTPYALQSGGWASSLLIIGLGIATAYAAHMIGKCVGKDKSTRSYADIGQKAFGTKGKYAAYVFIYMEIFMSLVSYTISLHDNLDIVFRGISLKLPIPISQQNLLTTLAVLVAIPSLWIRDMSSMSVLSISGIFLSLLIFCSISTTPLFGDAKPNQFIPVLELHKIPRASGLLIFSYAGHIVFPNICISMKDPSKFSKVVVVSFTLVTTLYIALGFMGAKLFGPGVSPQVTLSMPPDLFVSKIALWATVLTPMTKYALQFSPIAILIERNLPRSMASRTRTIVRASMGSVMLLLILLLALWVPYFQHVLSLTGSVVSIGICIILPYTFYTKIFHKELSKPKLILNLVIIMLGFVLGAFGTVSSSRLLAKTLRDAAQPEF